MKKFLSVLLSVCMLLSICSTLAVSSFAEETTTEKTSWDNGSIQDAVTNKSDYADGNVFSHKYYYAGTYDTVYKDGVGFHDMVKADDGHWRGVATEGGHADGNVYNTISSIEGSRATYHYSPAVCFKAPKSGTVEFVYQYAMKDSAWTPNYRYMIVKNNSSLPGDLRTLSVDPENGPLFLNEAATKFIGSGMPSGYDQQTVRIKVEKGDEICFVMWGSVGQSGNHEAMQWISSARYIEKGATVLGHGLATNDTLDLRFLVQIADPFSSNTATVTVKTPYGDKTQTVEGVLYTGEKKDGGNYTVDDHVYSFTVELNAKQLTDEVVLAAVNGDELNATYTVEDYCLGMRKLAAENAENTAYANAANTCEAILLYGYMAQINFNYNTDKLPAVKEALLNALTGANQ